MNTIDFKKFSVLLVEDDAVAREQLYDFLNDEFGKVYATESAVEGFDIFEKHSPEVVITDIQMEEMNGIELARAIKGISPNTILVVISAFCNDEYKQAAQDIEVDTYLTKPLNLENLLEKIAYSIELRDNSDYCGTTYIRFLLDNYPKAATEITNGEVSYINKKLLDLFRKDSIVEFFTEFKHFGDLFYKESGERFDEHARINYIKYLIDDIQKQKEVYIRLDGTITKAILTKHEFLKGDKLIIDIETIQGGG